MTDLVRFAFQDMLTRLVGPTVCDNRPTYNYGPGRLADKKSPQLYEEVILVEVFILPKLNNTPHPRYCWTVPPMQSSSYMFPRFLHCLHQKGTMDYSNSMRIHAPCISAFLSSYIPNLNFFRWILDGLILLHPRGEQ
jgi:hypothetical protein